MEGYGNNAVAQDPRNQHSRANIVQSCTLIAIRSISDDMPIILIDKRERIFHRLSRAVACLGVIPAYRHEAHHFAITSEIDAC
jgi:hypothetical protein